MFGTFQTSIWSFGLQKSIIIFKEWQDSVSLKVLRFGIYQVNDVYHSFNDHSSFLSRFQGPNRPAEIVTIPIGSTNIFAVMNDKNKNMLG